MKCFLCLTRDALMGREVCGICQFGPPELDFQPDGGFTPRTEITTMDEAVFERQLKEKEAKPPIQLIPYGPLEKVARVFGYGGQKYRPNLWRDYPTSVTARLGSAMRHIFLFNEGWEDNDGESGESHLAHAIVQLMFAMEYSTNPELDDRYQKGGDNA